jgi:hypothetical protein
VSLLTVPVDWETARAYTGLHHRHHKRPPAWHKTSIALIGGRRVVNGRAWNSTLHRRKPLSRSKGLTARAGLSRTGRKTLANDPERLRTLRGPESFPRRVCRLVDRRDSTRDGDRYCVGCGTTRGPFHRHHRRIKGAGGDPRPHTSCPCVAVTLCWLCHSWAHSHPHDAGDRGLIIPASVTEPRLWPVMVHGESGGVTAWATCGGEWVLEAPARRSA